MGADNFASYHSVSAAVINIFVFLPGCHSPGSPITPPPIAGKCVISEAERHSVKLKEQRAYRDSAVMNGYAY